MELKKWNHIQITAFDICKVDIENSVDVYRYASLISEYKRKPCDINTLIEIVEKINNADLENFDNS